MTEWHARAWAAMTQLASSHEPFTSDDLIDQAGQPDIEQGPNGGNNAIGALFREASNRGLIVSDGRLVKSRQKHRKGGAVRIWRGVEPPKGLF